MTDDFFEQCIDTSDQTSESIHEGGGVVAKEGRYHVQIESVELLPLDYDKKQLPHVKLMMRVLAGEHESEANKVVYSRIWMAGWEDKSTKNQAVPLKDGALKGVVAFLHAFGTIGNEAFGKNQFTLNKGMFERLEGTQAIIKITKGNNRTVTNKDGEEVTYQGRYEMAWTNDCWPLGHEKVKDVPVDNSMVTAQMVASGQIDDDLGDL